MTSVDTTPAAIALLNQSTQAHGEAAFAQLHDINVSYAGNWHPLVTKLQPVLTDPGFRGGSEERILVKDRIIGQSHQGPRGRKEVVRRSAAGAHGDVRVWFNDQETIDEDSRHAAALVVDAYCLFLLGPLWISQLQKSGRPVPMTVTGAADVVDGNHRFRCDVLRVALRPGIGLSEEDQLAIYIDQETKLMRRVRFSLEGLDSTRGALVEVDTFSSVRVGGIEWPTRFHERLLRPAPLAVHDWQLTGLDLDRGYSVVDIAGTQLTDAAQSSAMPLLQGDNAI